MFIVFFTTDMFLFCKPIFFSGNCRILRDLDFGSVKTRFKAILKNAAIPASKYGFTKQKHIRGDKTLKIQNFGPNVVYFVLGTRSVSLDLEARAAAGKVSAVAPRWLPRPTFRDPGNQVKFRENPYSKACLGKNVTLEGLDQN